MASAVDSRGRHLERSALTALLPVVALVPFWLLAMAVIWLPIRLIVDIPIWVLPLVWLAAGALLFIPSVQVSVLSPLFGARIPSAEEQQIIAPIWRDLAVAANLPSYRYAIRVIDSDELNAFACGGRGRSRSATQSDHNRPTQRHQLHHAA